MNIHKLFTDDTVEVDKSEATEEAPCGAVLPSLYSKIEKDDDSIDKQRKDDLE
jgi:hypothetical protein